MTIPTRAHDLVGRQVELDAVRAWAELLADGPAALVIGGEAGIGKTTVWSAATATAAERGARVVKTRPVEAELPLGYAGLGDLLGLAAEPILGDLPEPQARALSAALALGAVPASQDPLLVGRATLAALRRLAAASEIVIAIDDVQWLDPPSARALAFAARRLGDARVGFVVSLRAGHDEPLGLAEALGDRSVDLRLGGLSVGALGHLLRSRGAADLPRRNLLRIHERSAGNPFFAIQLVGAGEGGLPSSLRDLVRRRLEGVSAVAEPAIEFVAVLGPSSIAAFDDPIALDAAVSSGILIEQEDGVRFAHPLLAAGAYERIPPGRRQALHRDAAALSETIEERARHLALASTSPDAATAALLDAAAQAARIRGAPETAAELAAHARRLTPVGDGSAQARRMMDQADYLFLAADEPSARALIDELLTRDPSGTTRVRALVQSALLEVDPQVAVAHLEAAVKEPHDDPILAARTLAQLAWQRGAWLGDVEPAIVEALAAVESAEAIGDEATLAVALATAGLVMSIDGRHGAEDHFRRALAIIDQVPTAAGDHSPGLAFANARSWRGDFVMAEALLSADRLRAEQHGDESQLMRLNIFGAGFALRRGDWNEAERRIEEALADARDYWRIMALIQRGILRGRRGQRDALTDAAEIRSSRPALVDPIILAAADFVAGLIDLAESRQPQAAERMVRLLELSDGSATRRAEYAVLIPETVGALVEADRTEQADALTRQLERRLTQLEPWGTAAAAMCRGLLALAAGDTTIALDRLAAAIEGFEAIGAPWELAQSRLAEGRALRRIGRRLDAAGSLELAETLFARLGAEPARRQAVDELRRARPRPRHDDSLTAAETRVAALVAAGNTNREVAARLFTTVATVEAHLTRIYSKLGIRSRTELARRVSDGSLGLDVRASDEPPT